MLPSPSHNFVRGMPIGGNESQLNRIFSIASTIAGTTIVIFHVTHPKGGPPPISPPNTEIRETEPRPPLPFRQIASVSTYR